jgi:predicted small secreted protein
MRRALAILALSAVVAGCRTARPAGEETPSAALTSTTAEDAARQLAARRAQLTSARSLLRIRATNAGRSLSFRAQLQVDKSGCMLLTAYTPFGTNAMRLYADGGEVTFINDFEGTWWKGGVAEFGRSFGFFGSASPSSMALLIIGLPAGGRDFTYEYAAAGLKRATAGDTVVIYDPPSYPPQHVLVSRTAQSLDIETLESSMTIAPITPPVIPSSYRCCVAPKM